MAARDPAHSAAHPPEIPHRQLLSILKLFVSAGRNTRLYPPGHPTVMSALDSLAGVAATALEHRRAIRYDIWGGTVLANRQPVTADPLFIAEFTAHAVAHGVGSLDLLRGVTRDDFARAATLFAMEPEELIMEGGLRDAVTASGITQIVFGPPKMWGSSQEDVVHGTPVDLYRWAAETYAETAADARTEGTLDPLRAQFVIEALVQVLARSRADVARLIASGEHGEDSPYHAVNVAILCLMLGAQAGLTDRALQALGLAGYLHDLGLAASDRVPLARGEHAEPWHAYAGAYLLRDATGWDRAATVAAVEHHAHERGGYLAQHPFSRAVAIADVYDAQTSARAPLPRRRPHEMIRALLAEAGTTYDPGLVAAFVQAWGLFPVGTVVRLDDGLVGVVVAESAQPDRPAVRAVDVHGKAPRGTIVEMGGNPERQITAELDGRAIGTDPKTVVMPG
jgi:hypothetical protein